MVKNICVSLVGAYLINQLASYLGSSFLESFLSQNLITLLIALLAINITTMSVLLTQLKEISSEAGNFKNTIREMKHSVVEQIVLIFFSVIIQIIMGAGSIKANVPNLNQICVFLLAVVFVFAISILYDTAKGIFVILEYEKPNSDS